MIEGLPFLYQAKGGTVYHVAEKVVKVVQPLSLGESIVAFVDGDDDSFDLNDILIHPSVQLIVASPPKVTSEEWIKQAGDTATELAIELWSEKELFLTGLVLALPINTRLKPLCRIFLNRFDLPFKLLRESTSYFGYNPRQCFGASLSVSNLYGKRDRTVFVIKDAATHNNFVQLFRSTQSGTNNVSHMIFQISPTDTNRLLSSCKFEPVSRWAFEHLLCQYEEMKPNAAAELYFALSRRTDAATLRGHLFERQANQASHSASAKRPSSALLPPGQRNASPT
jgi:hypothetical protein